MDTILEGLVDYDASIVQYVALNKLHSMYISSYMQVLDKQSEE